MREILFRGKTQEHTRWIYGDLNHYMCDDGVFIAENGYSMHRVLKETVGQFTGLTDKNDKKIFEGDIVECFSSDYAGRPKIDTIIVKDMTDYNTMVYLNCSNELKIIGNIQDSPKPFKGGADNV